MAVIHCSTKIFKPILEGLLKSGGALVIPKPTKEHSGRHPKRTGGGRVPRAPDADGNPT